MRTKSPPSGLPTLPRRLNAKNKGETALTLHELLRRIALENQQAEPQTFYSLREVAKNFALPLSQVSRVFARLEKEGLLGRVRGSRTVLHSRKYNRNLRVRGIVGLPVNIFRFLALTDYRVC